MSQENSLISAPLSEGVLLEGHILSTRTADAYKGIERATGKPVCIWKLRHPLSTGGESINRFLSRMESLRGLGRQVTPIKYFGVEPNGLAYAVLEGLDGRSTLDGKLDATEAERRFLTCVRLVGAVHKSGQVCGDLCGASFWNARSGETILVGVMGSFDTEAVSTAMMPPLETLQFVAPEQRMGGGIEQASDVFSLGVLGYQLFTGKSPFGSSPAAVVSLDKVAPLRSLNPQAPDWMHEIIMKCLEPSANLRIQNANSLAQTILERRKVITEQLPAASAHAVQPKSGAIAPAGVAQGISVYRGAPKDENASAPGPRTLMPKFLVIGAVVAVLAVPLVYYFTQYRSNATSGSGAAGTPIDTGSILPPIDNGQLQQTIENIQSSGAALPEKLKEITALENSDDPISHAMLVKASVVNTEEEVRSAAEKSLLARVRRLGLPRTADHLRQWLRFRVNGETPNGYESLLKLGDPSLPLDARASLLRQTYPGNERTVLRLAAAYAFDANKLDEMQPIISQLVGDAQHLTDASQHAAVALIALSPELSVAFSEDLSQTIKSLNGPDLLWLMGALADRDDPLLRSLARAVVQKNILSSQRRIFLDVLQEKKELPADISTALIRAASGNLKREDLASLGNWFDGDAERVLLGLCAEQYDPAMMLEIFDILAGKSVTSEPAASLLKWIRDNDWEHRSIYISAMGIVATRAEVSNDRIEKILEAFRPHIKKSGLMKIFIQSKSVPLVSGLLRLYGIDLNLGILLNLLDFPDKDIRIGALEIIAKYNDVTVFKLVIDHYEKEKDPEVRAAYQKKFWVIREREKGGAAAP